MTWTITIGATSYEDTAIEGVTIYTGREEIDRQPNPSTATIRLIRDSSLGVIDPQTWAYGAKVKIVNGASRIRFVGQLVDVSYDRYTITTTCVSEAARWPSLRDSFGGAPGRPQPAFGQRSCGSAMPATRRATAPVSPQRR